MALKVVLVLSAAYFGALAARRQCLNESQVLEGTCDLPNMECVDYGDWAVKNVIKRLSPDHPMGKLDATGNDLFCSPPACLSNPCLHGGACRETFDGFSCQCKNFASGAQCENIDECASNPCVNSTCIDGVEAYRCTCSPGYTGDSCSTDIDECASNPCVNGACTDDVNDYHCTCLTGFTDKNCSTNVDDCVSNHCVNGTCIDGVNDYKCECAEGFTGITCSTAYFPIDCEEVFVAGHTSSGVYPIYIGGSSTPTKVYCDMDTAGGRWTIFQKRFDGKVDFDIGWWDYLVGFGDVEGEYWLGNENLHGLTSQRTYRLRVDMWDWDGDTAHAEYSSFEVGPGGGFFRLTVSGYSGTAGDGLDDHNEAFFSTPDADHDTDSSRHCGKLFGGGWWYKHCYVCNLNGRYHVGGSYTGARADGTEWREWKNMWYSLKRTEMKIRPV